jgi:hypothetical protein
MGPPPPHTHAHTHTQSGMVCGEEVFNTLSQSGDTPCAETFELPAGYNAAEVTAYQSAIESSWAYEELKEVRNCHASFHWGFVPGLMYTGLSTFLLKGKEPWTIKNTDTDSAKTGIAANFKEISYPKPDGKLSFDLLTNLSFSGTDHNEQVRGERMNGVKRRPLTHTHTHTHTHIHTHTHTHLCHAPLTHTFLSTPSLRTCESSPPSQRYQRRCLSRSLVAQSRGFAPPRFMATTKRAT